MKKRPAKPAASASWSASNPKRTRENLAFALAASLYLHGMMILLQFGVPGLGLPAMAWPWQERRVQASDLTVRLVEAPRPPAPARAPVPKPAPVTAAPRVPPTPATAKQRKPVAPSRAGKSFESRLSATADAAPPALAQREAAERAPAAKARVRERKVAAKPKPRLLAQTDPQEETFKVPVQKPVEPEQRAPESAAKKQVEESPPEVDAAEQAARKQAEDAARLKGEEAARLKAEEEARQRAIALRKEAEARKQQEARRLEDAQKQEEARRQALELEARKLAEETAKKDAEELARQRAVAVRKEQEAKKVEETRKQEEAKKQEEIRKQEEARRLALEAEALKRAEEAARQQAVARQKELEARRQAEEAAARAKEAAEHQRVADGEATAQRERDRIAGQQAPGQGPARAPGSSPAPGALSGKELAAKAIDQLRSRIDPPRPQLPPASPDTPRRRALIGAERDVSLRMYVDSWRSKIERNGPLNYRASAGARASDNAIVTVSIRSDGSLEDVHIHRSSGLREVDEAVRRIARLYAPYSAFPPELARQYDVIEIRRVWSFESTLKIMDEM